MYLMYVSPSQGSGLSSLWAVRIPAPPFSLLEIVEAKRCILCLPFGRILLIND
jgi:hypothetical protein